MLIPTCDDTERPVFKGAIHAATAALYALMLVYHVSAALLHLTHPHD